MKLNKQHREALIEQLKEASIKADNANSFLTTMREQEDKESIPFAEINVYLAEQRVKLIEQILIDNEIDF